MWITENCGFAAKFRSQINHRAGETILAASMPCGVLADPFPQAEPMRAGGVCWHTADHDIERHSP
jgi:hypothetical protein